MDYYDILGMPKTASDDEIKAAYRRLAMKFHPDRADGDADAFKQVQAAYECLSDPARRAAYDEFGFEPPQRAPVDAAAREVLTTTFTHAMAAPHPHFLQLARQYLLDMGEDAQVQLASAAKTKEALLKRRAKVKTAAGVANLFHALIDDRVASLVRDIERATRALEIQAAALKLLDNYSEEAPEPQPQPQHKRLGIDPSMVAMAGWWR